MIKVRVSGIDRVVRRMEQLESQITERNRKFLERLGEIGVDTARIRFSNAQYDGVNDVIVRRPEWVDEKTLRINADGHSVAFIEFGTGVHYSEQHPLAAELHLVRGSYGHHLGLQDSWRYKGAPGTNGEMTNDDWVWTHGNPPARAMYDAGKEIRDKVREIAREVFSSD